MALSYNFNESNAFREKKWQRITLVLVLMTHVFCQSSYTLHCMGAVLLIQCLDLHSIHSTQAVNCVCRFLGKQSHSLTFLAYFLSWHSQRHFYSIHQQQTCTLPSLHDCIDLWLVPCINNVFLNMEVLLPQTIATVVKCVHNFHFLVKDMHLPWREKHPKVCHRAFTTPVSSTVGCSMPSKHFMWKPYRSMLYFLICCFCAITNASEMHGRGRFVFCQTRGKKNLMTTPPNFSLRTLDCTIAIMHPFFLLYVNKSSVYVSII